MITTSGGKFSGFSPIWYFPFIQSVIVSALSKVKVANKSCGCRTTPNFSLLKFMREDNPNNSGPVVFGIDSLKMEYFSKALVHHNL